MFQIIWNLSDFSVFDRLRNDTKMNNAYFVTNLLIPLEPAISPRGKSPHQKRQVVHFDNCSVHTSRASTDWLEEHGIRRVPYPSYSCSLASSDFYLFRTVKKRLERIQVADEDQLFECLQEVLKGLDQQELNRVFQTWVRRIQQVSQAKTMEMMSDDK
jgi:hypothetical protein